MTAYSGRVPWKDSTAGLAGRPEYFQVAAEGLRNMVNGGIQQPAKDLWFHARDQGR